MGGVISAIIGKKPKAQAQPQPAADTANKGAQDKKTSATGPAPSATDKPAIVARRGRSGLVSGRKDPSSTRGGLSVPK